MGADNWTYCPNSKNHTDDEDGETFREYYEFYGAETGMVTAKYNANCIKKGCSAHLSFTYSEKVKLENEL